MQKALFFAVALFDCSCRNTELLIQSLRTDWSSLKRDENSTGQGSNSKVHIKFVKCHSGADEWWRAPVVDNERKRQFEFENPQNLVIDQLALQESSLCIRANVKQIIFNTISSDNL